MTNDKRACIAFICGMKVNPYRNKQMVFDYSKGEFLGYASFYFWNSCI